jgi:hypothetical protein
VGLHRLAGVAASEWRVAGLGKGPSSSIYIYIYAYINIHSYEYIYAHYLIITSKRLI